MINYSYDKLSILRLPKYLRHELVHMFYEKIWSGKYDRILWLDEGLAQYLSHEKSDLDHDEVKFKAWYLSLIIGRFKKIPNIEFFREQGDTYGKFVDGVSNSYNGYDWSYLMVRYLVESDKDIVSILKDIDKIRELEGHIIEDTLDYYNSKFEVRKIKQNFNDIKTPQELMNYMNLFTVYGWLDIKGIMHIGNLKDFRKNYRTGTINEIIDTGIGTCIE